MLVFPSLDDKGENNLGRMTVMVTMMMMMISGGPAGRVQRSTGINSSLLTSSSHVNTQQKVKPSQKWEKKKDMNGLLVAFQL